MKTVNHLYNITVALAFLFAFNSLCSSVLADDTRIEALDGGVVDLSGVTHIIGLGSGVNVVAEGEGSVVKLTNLELILDDVDGQDSSLYASNQGLIELNSHQATELGNHVNLHVTTTGMFSFNDLTLNPGSLLYGQGSLPGNIVNSGLISPGEGESNTGSLIIAGDYTQTARGRLAIELGDSVPGSGFDLFSVSGVVNLGGALDIKVINGFLPVAGSNFGFVSGASRSGEFASANGLILPDGSSFSIVYNETGALLHAAGTGFQDQSGPVLSNVQFDGTAFGNNSLIDHPAYFTATVNDISGVSHLQYILDGDLLGTSFSAEDHYAQFWNPATVSDGFHTLTLIAFDTLHNTTIVTYNFNVVVPPPLIKTYDVYLAAGFNIVNYPVEVPLEHQTCLGLLSSLGNETVVSEISRYNPLNGIIERCDHTASSDFDINTGNAMIIKMLQARTFQFSGAQLCPAGWQVYPGPNYVGHSAAPEGMKCFTLLNAASNSAISLQRFNLKTGRFDSCFWYEGQTLGINYPVLPTDGLILNTNSQQFIELPGCD